MTARLPCPTNILVKDASPLNDFSPVREFYLVDMSYY